jgi:POT family proton-dependent oligopeptide transporter
MGGHLTDTAAPSTGNDAVGTASGTYVDTRPQWYGHPAQLARLFTTEAMERFGYYGMRALLTLYLADHFLFSDSTTTSLYGGFTALVYLTPLIGGLVADRYLGSKRSVKFGAILMAIGYFILCFGGDAAKPFATIEGTRYEVVIEGPDKQQFVVNGDSKLAIKGNEDGSVSLLSADGSAARTIAKGSFEAGGDRDATFITIMLIGLSAVTVGNGFFKPNISTMVGSLYRPGDQRRDAGFTIFYMGINLGSLASQLACPFLADRYGWWAGFLLAAIGMTISWALIQFAGPKLAGYGEPPEREGPDRSLAIYAAAILAIPLFWMLFTNLMNAPAPTAGQGIIGYVLGLPILGKVLFATFLAAVIGIPIWSWRVGTRQEFQMMGAALVLIVFNVVFWTLFEQAGSSLTLFANRNTDLSIFGMFSISAGQTQFFNAFFIVALAPVFGALWVALARRGLEPGIPVKFGMALVGVGLGFLFLVWGTSFADEGYKVAIWWLAGLYLIHSIAELMISPVGLSMITKLSIARVVGMMMGVWFLSISCAQYVAGVVAQVASVETVGGQVTNARLSLETYAGVFSSIGWVSVVIGALLLILSPFLKRWMHGVS